MSVEIRAMAIEDYDQVVALWREEEGICLSERDTREKIDEYLRRNPGLSFVACEREKVVGAVLCGHDGRRGMLHHLAVARSHRRRGLGRALVQRCLDGLAEQGMERCHIFVLGANVQGKAFWQRIGYREYEDLSVMYQRTAAFSGYIEARPSGGHGGGK